MWLNPSFEPIVGDDLGLGVELDAEPRLVARGDLAAEVGDARWRRCSGGSASSRAASQSLSMTDGLGRVGRVAHAQVDDVDARRGACGTSAR